MFVCTHNAKFSDGYQKEFTCLTTGNTWVFTVRGKDNECYLRRSADLVEVSEENFFAVLSAVQQNTVSI